MLEITLTPQQAEDVADLLEKFARLKATLPGVPGTARYEMSTSILESANAVSQKLRAELDNLQQAQHAMGGDRDSWELPEKLARLEISAPPDWNEYDAYLLNGGELEYEEWREQKGGDRNV